MANIVPTPSYDDIIQIDISPSIRVQGGPGGPANFQAQNIANRFAYLEGSAGASKIGNDGETVAQALNKSRTLASYTDLRAYTGNATRITLTGNGIYGDFTLDSGDVSSLDNGVVTIIDGAGRRWKRQYNGPILACWSGVLFDDATDNTATVLAADAVALSIGKKLQFQTGTARIGRMTLANGDRHWVGDNTVIMPLPGLYSSNLTPCMSGSFSNCTVTFENITFDQHWTYGYPSGYSRNDQYKASSWGGGGWFAVFNGNQTAKIHYLNVHLKDNFRGFNNIEQKEVIVSEKCNVTNDLPTYLNDCGFSSELCLKVVYDDVDGSCQNWQDSGGTLTGAYAYFGNSCVNVQLSDIRTDGYQMVFHGTEPSAPDVGVGRRLTATGLKINHPVADTAFYRWKQMIASVNEIYASGDMGIAANGSTFAAFVSNIIDGTHIGGIASNDCEGVVISSNVIKNIAQNYPEIHTIANRYAGNAGAYLAAIECDYQSGGGKAVDMVINGNTMGFDTFPPVSDIYGPVRAAVGAILIQTSPNLASQSTVSVCGNRAKADYTNLPSFFINVPDYRFYIAPAGKTGTPIGGEVFSDGVGNSFVYINDYGAGNLCFLKKKIGTITALTAFTGVLSGATITPAALPQLTWLNCTGSGNFDWTTTAENQNIGV